MKKTLLIVGVFLLGQLVAGAILAIAFAARASSQGADMAADYVPPLYDMLVALMVSDIIIIVATILICRKGFVEPFRWNMPAARGVTVTLLSLVGMTSLVVLTEAFAEWLDLPDYMADTVQAASLSPLRLWAMAIVGPLAEEIACRYGIAGSLLEKKYPAWAVILISAIFFSILHMNPAQMLVAFIIGVFLGWLYVITRSVWPCIIVHVANNAVSVVMMRLNPDNPEEMTLSNMIDNNALYIGVLCGCAVVFAVAVYALHKTAAPLAALRDKH